MTIDKHTFRFQLHGADGKPICGFDILEQARTWGRRVMGAPYDIFDTQTANVYRVTPSDEDQVAEAGPTSFDGPTLANLVMFYNAGCTDPTFMDARAWIEAALSSATPKAGRAALAAQLMLVILHGADR